MEMKHIFVSYAREDKSSALEIYELLKQHGFSVWIDSINLLSGQDWKKEIEKAIRESEIFIACLSKNSVNKRGFVQAELRKALEVLETIPEGDIFIIPIRFDKCKVPSELSKLHWLDYFASDAKERLINSIQYHLKIAEEFSANNSIAEAKSSLPELVIRANLTEKQRQFLELVMDGYSTDAISKKLNISKRAVYSLKYHTLSKLRKAAENFTDI